MKPGIYNQDCLEAMKKIKDNSISSVVTDPPYGIGFMGKEWDTFKSGNAKNIADKDRKYLEQDGSNPRQASDAMKAGKYDLSLKAVRRYQDWCHVWAFECLRILKPGGHLLASNSSRMYHRMAVAIEDAGFEIRDQIMWVYGSGFPKSLNIGKEIDKRKDWSKYEEFAEQLKQKRQQLGLTKHQAFEKCDFKAKTFGGNSWFEDGRIPSSDDYTILKIVLDLNDSFDVLFEKVKRELLGQKKGKIEGFFNPGIGNYKTGYIDETKGNSEWEGWGTALKPAHEPIVVARKPLDGTVANNILKWGTGGINIDGCRIQYKDESDKPNNSSIPDIRNKGVGIEGENMMLSVSGKKRKKLEGQEYEASNKGRFPSNLILTYPENEYLCRKNLTKEQKDKLYKWLNENT